ncbi:hypothetical protein SprV_0100314300 [Sparganum proliferum]
MSGPLFAHEHLNCDSKFFLKFKKLAMSSDDAVGDGQTAIIQRPPTSGDLFTPDNDLFLLPSVEQMQMDVANATFELQKAYIPRRKHPVESLEGNEQENSSHTINTLGVEKVDPPIAEVPDSEDNLPDLPDSDDNEDPSQRTREETVSEELLIDGKRYRHTYQRRVVLERQKTREVFVLPTSTASLKPSTSQPTDKECASSLINCNKSLDRNVAAKTGCIGGDRGSYGMRLDLSVQNRGGAFSPVVVLLPENEARTPPTASDHLKGASTTTSEQEQGRLENQELDDGLSGEPSGAGGLEKLSSVRDMSLKLERPTGVEIEPADPAENSCETPTTPLLLSHMYHFGKWDKAAPILDPRLPAGITQRDSDAAELAFSVSPAEWHQTDISYGDTGGGSGAATSTFGTVAKGRIVACLQRFTQKSARTGRHLYRSTYVQHTKIARWRSTNKETGPQYSQELHSPDHKPHFSASAPEDSVGFGLFEKGPNEVSTLEGIWKQGARAGDSLATAGPHLTPVCTLLDVCSYDRLQLLQSICPAAAAATVILGRQIPDMRRSPGPTARGGRPAGAAPASAVGESVPTSPIFTVSADAWCPRELMMLEAPPDALIFMSPTGCTDGDKRGSTDATGADATTDGPPNSNQNDGHSAHHDCLLRGGTLDGLLVYSLKIFREKQTGSYESLVPDIFLKLYSTFTTANEIVCRLMQRYIAFAPIEPGGLGCLAEDGQQSSEGAWTEALNTARFLVKVLSEAAPSEFSSQFMLKIVHYARVLQMDSKNAQNRLSSNGPIHAELVSGIKANESLGVNEAARENHTTTTEQGSEDVCFQTPPRQLEDLANQLLLLIPYSSGGLKVPAKTDGNGLKTRVIVGKATITSDPEDPDTYCSCHQRLHKLLRFNTREIAEQITLNEENYFQKIDLKELIAIKRLMKGNTPTLSNCVKHFNGVSSWVKVLLRMANEYGSPRRLSFSSSTSTTSSYPSTPTDQNSFPVKTGDDRGPQGGIVVCKVCGLPQQPRPRKPPGGSPTNGLNFSCQMRPCLSGPELKTAPSSDRCPKTKNYLCMTSGSQHLSLRSKRQNLLLENVLWKLCCVAEELRQMNNFSSFLALILGIQNASLPKVSKKLKSKLAEFGAYMVPPAFTTYRHDLETAKMPCLPYLGLIFQQLIHLDSGNALFLPSRTHPGETDAAIAEGTSTLITDDEQDSQKVVNYWRCWKHYLILGYFIKRLQLSEEEGQGSYGFSPKPEIDEYLRSFEGFSEAFPAQPPKAVKRQSVLYRKSRRIKTVTESI